MKTRKNWLKDNRGAALISIMIAVAFISILASALLYMAYSNYKMKVVNYESKVNFYGTEHDMTELTTVIRNDITKSNDPVAELKKLVGFVPIDASNPNAGRYSPNSLARLVYGDTIGATTSTTTPQSVPVNADTRAIDSNGTLNVTFTSKDLSSTSPNFLVETVTDPTDADHGLTRITLKDVVIEQQTTDDNGNYNNKITTDLVYRIKKSSVPNTPGGIGEFSMLMDSPITGASTNPTRVTMYGNTFIGPGTYVYSTDPTTGKKVVDPGAANALTLGGNAVYTVNGDYMIVFGNIELDGNAILNIISGQVTILGDVILKGNSSFVCTGDLFFPTGYGIKLGTGGNANNIIPHTLWDTTTTAMNTSAVNFIEQDKYDSLLTTLKLNDYTPTGAPDETNDGILNQILSGEQKPDGTHAVGIEDYSNVTQTSKVNYYGIDFQSAIVPTNNINAGDYENNLCFLLASKTTIKDGANLHSTLISKGAVEFDGQKNILFSQLGEDVFAYLTRLSTSTGFPASEPYDTDVHEFHANIGHSSHLEYVNNSTTTVVGSFFKPDANQTVNDIIGFATNNTSGKAVVESAVGYTNWTKE